MQRVVKSSGLFFRTAMASSKAESGSSFARWTWVIHSLFSQTKLKALFGGQYLKFAMKQDWRLETIDWAHYQPGQKQNWQKEKEKEKQPALWEWCTFCGASYKLHLLWKLYWHIFEHNLKCKCVHLNIWGGKTGKGCLKSSWGLSTSSLAKARKAITIFETEQNEWIFLHLPLYELLRNFADSCSSLPEISTWKTNIFW